MDTTGASPVGPARKTLFRKSGGDEPLSSDGALDSEERLNQSDKQVIQETITHLREEVKEMERSAWLYETVNEQAINV